MTTKLWLVTRAVACLIPALTSLGAAPIYHAHYQGQATLTSGTLTCTESIAYDADGNVPDHSETCSGGSELGAFNYGEYPIYSLPSDSVLLSSQVRQWGYFDIEVFDEIHTVEPIDPGEPFIPGGFAGYRTFTNIWASDWPFYDMEAIDYTFGSGWVPDRLRRAFDLMDTTLANEYTLWTRDVRLYVSSGPWDFSPYGGINSVSTLTHSYRIGRAAAFYSVDITYEVPIPEPATASLFLAGAAGFLLIRLLRR